MQQSPDRRAAKKNCHGKNGEDLILKVPEGTLIKDAASGKVIADMSGDNTRQVILRGGKGGQGNQHYATSTMQAPKYAQPGQDAIEIEVQLELKVIADVGACRLSKRRKINTSVTSYQCTAKDCQLSFHHITAKSWCG